MALGLSPPPRCQTDNYKEPAMTSRLKTAKKGKGSKSTFTTPKIQVTTVSALFKRQIQQQESREKESDDDVAFIKEERSSPYFSPPKSPKRSVTVSGACTHESNMVKAEPEHKGDLHAEKRLSRRLSLKKARSRAEECIQIPTVTSCSAARAGGDADSSYSGNSPQVSDPDQKRNASHSLAACETDQIRSLTVQNTDHRGSRFLEREPSTIAITQHEEERSSVHSNALEASSSRGKLSLKRKKKSEEDVSRAPSKKSPPKPQDGEYACIIVTDSDTAPESLTHATSTSPSESPAFTSRHSSVDPVGEATSSPKGIKSLPTSVSGVSTSDSGSSTTSTSKTAVSKNKPEGIQSLFTSASGIVAITIDTDSSTISTTSTSKAKTRVVPENKVSLSASQLKTRRSSSSALSKTAAILKDSEIKDKADKGDDVVNETEGMDRAEVDDEDSNAEMVYRVPYYLENFNTIVKSVFEDEYNLKLFDHTDFEHLASFKHLSEAAQKLYVRLFSRKLAWLSTSKIKYPEIAEDLTPLYGELVSAGLVSSGDDVQDLSAVLRAMSAPDLRTLAKLYHINSSGQQKGQIILALLAKCQQSTIASMFGQKIGAVRDTMLKRAKKLLGPVYCLQEEPRKLFMRAMMLFSLINTNGDEESGSGGQAQLFQMLMVNIGRVVYPAYTVNRQTQVFRCREDLKRFEEALQLENELLACTGSGNWNKAYTVFLTVKEQYDELILNSEVTEWDANLPDFLRSYTAGSVLVRLMSHSIEILQRRKDYTAAVTLIRELLRQRVYQQDHHGYWWDRLALNLDVHLKQQQQALQAIQDGLADGLVRTGHRLSLYLRAEAICNRPKSPFSRRLKDFNHEPMLELPKAVVEGRVLPHTLPGSRYQFITDTSYAEGNCEEVTMCNVEQIVLDYYKVNGFPQGIHAEGSVVSTLFCVYFWDVLFMDVADAFHSPYQTSPLDLHTDAFYQRRQESITQRLAELEQSSEEELENIVAELWEKQNGVMCAGINWERFKSAEEIQGLVRCIGGTVLAGILGRYAQQPRHTRSGFPDLTLWNTETKKLKISEVKGPGDRLSHKQMLWLDHLLKLGVDAEVCHVKPVGVKKLKPTPKV